MIRRAGEADVERVARMAMAAHREAGEGGEPDMTAAVRVAEYAIENGAVFMSRDGCLAAHVVPSPIAPSWRIASEVFWRVERGATEAMLRAFVAWARGVAHEARVASEAVGAMRNVVGRKMRIEGFEFRGAAYVRRF